MYPSRSCTRQRDTLSPVRPTLERCTVGSWLRLKTTWTVRSVLGRFLFHLHVHAAADGLPQQLYEALNNKAHCRWSCGTSLQHSLQTQWQNLGTNVVANDFNRGRFIWHCRLWAGGEVRWWSCTSIKTAIACYHGNGFYLSVNGESRSIWLRWVSRVLQG